MVNNTECSTINSSLSKQNLEYLQCYHLEEADAKVILHIDHAVQHGYKNVFVLSSDTDIIVLSMYYFKHFQSNGLQVI